MSSLKERGYEWKSLKEFYEETPDVSCTEILKDNFRGYSGLWCQTIAAPTIAGSMIHDVVSLGHGPLGCASSSRTFYVNHVNIDFGSPFAYFPSTAMGNSEVIFGGEEKLAEALRFIDKEYKPELIVVFSNCCPMLIRDDVEGVVENVQPELEAKVVHYEAGGFVGCTGGAAGAFRDLMVFYTKLMDPPKKVDKEAVNILGMYKETFCSQGPRCAQRKYPTDADELTRYIEALGLRLHRVIFSGDLDYHRTAPEAGVNTIACCTRGLTMSKAMQKLFGTPYLKHNLIFGVEITKKWVMDLANFAGRQEKAERFIREEYSQIEEIWEECKKAVRGKVFLGEGGRTTMLAGARVLALARMAIELGMEAYIFNFHPIEMKGRDDDIEYFLEDGINPQCLVGEYAYQYPIKVWEIMKDLGLDRDQVVYFHNDVFPYAQAGIIDPSNSPRVESASHFRRTKDAPGRCMGYRGTAALARDIIEAIKTAQRGTRPTLYGRIYGEPLEFDMVRR